MYSLLLKSFLLIGVLLLALGWIRLGLSRARRSRREVALAKNDFRRRAGRLANEFRAASAAIGQCFSRTDLTPEDPLLARDQATNELVALASLRAFDLDGQPVAAPSTAVFTWREGKWTTDGRFLAGLSPRETLAYYSDTLAAV